MSLVEFVIDKLDDLKGTEIVHFDVKGKSSITENAQFRCLLNHRVYQLQIQLMTFLFLFK